MVLGDRRTGQENPKRSLLRPTLHDCHHLASVVVDSVLKGLRHKCQRMAHGIHNHVLQQKSILAYQDRRSNMVLRLEGLL